MATQTTYPTSAQLTTDGLTDTAINTRVGIFERRRQHRAERKRRVIAAGLRRTADPIQPPRRFDPCPVLVDRVAPIRDELLQLADALEQTQAPDPACVALLRELLTNGTSPLYNPNIHVSALRATLDHVRAGLQTRVLDPYFYTGEVA